MLRHIFKIAALVAVAHASIHCSIHGDTHVLMSDGTSKYQHHSGGLFRVFATAVSNKQLEVQCDFTDRTADMTGAVGVGIPSTTGSSMFIDPEMSSCRLKVFDINQGCGVDIRHGGLQAPGMGWIAGQQMALSAMGQVPINSALGVHIVPLTNNALSVEVNWNGTFVQVVMAERSVQIHGPAIGACVGLCGTCAGLQTPPVGAAAITQFISTFAVPAALAIQPQQICSANPYGPQNIFGGLGNTIGNGAPQLFMQQQMLTQYPTPQYTPPSLLDSLYTTSFASPTIAQLVFQQCSNNEVNRIQFDPVFNSFVEDCMYDKSLGPGYVKAAKATMDAFVTWTESLNRLNRVQMALLANPFATVCAACIPVQWSDPVQTSSCLMPAVTTTAQGKLQEQNPFVYPNKYNGQNTYALNAVTQALAGSSFNSPQWNSNIVLPGLSTLGLQPLPSQLVSSPIALNGMSQPSDALSQAVNMNMNMNPNNFNNLQQTPGNMPFSGAFNQQINTPLNQQVNMPLNQSPNTPLNQLQGGIPTQAMLGVPQMQGQQLMH